MSGTLTPIIQPFPPERKNARVGSASFLIPELKLLIWDASILHSCARLSADGCAVRDERGQIVYSPAFQRTDKRVADAFLDRVVADLLELYPEAFS